MKTRITTGIYIVIGLIITLFSRFFTPYFFDVIVSILAIIATFEISNALEKAKKYNFQSVAGLYPTIMFVMIYLGFNYNLGWLYYVLSFVSVVVLSLLGLTFAALFQLQKESQDSGVFKSKYAWKLAVKKALYSTAILVYPTMFFASLLVLNRFSELSIVQNTALGTELFEWFVLLLAILIPIGCDIFAMLTGMALKGPKLAPKISPKKTVSGFFGGLAGGILFSYLIYLLFSINTAFKVAVLNLGGIWFVLLVGLFGAIACQIGDLFASLIKRRAFIKDYGKIFPGHGGVMDRYDGLIFTSTLVLVSLLVILLSV